jgi:hypothetical protein
MLGEQLVVFAALPLPKVRAEVRGLAMFFSLKNDEMAI